ICDREPSRHSAGGGCGRRAKKQGAPLAPPAFWSRLALALLAPLAALLLRSLLLARLLAGLLRLFRLLRGLLGRLLRLLGCLLRLGGLLLGLRSLLPLRRARRRAGGERRRRRWRHGGRLFRSRRLRRTRGRVVLHLSTSGSMVPRRRSARRARPSLV